MSGYQGKMGSTVVGAVNDASDMQLVGGFDPAHGQSTVVLNGRDIAPAYTNLKQALEETQPDVMVDFSLPNAAVSNLKAALAQNVRCVLGTTGVSPETLEELVKDAPVGATLFCAPNFTTGAVLMMAASKLAAAWFDDVEVIEFHHNNKKDAPSGTAIATARLIAEARQARGVTSVAPGSETELDDLTGARGAELPGADVRLHAVRSNGFVASQEVIFGSPGQTLTIRHDSFDRTAYMPGVLLAVRRIGELSGLVIGLEELIQL